MEHQPSPQEPAKISNSAVVAHGKTMRWSDDLDRQLFLAIISQVPGYDVLRLVDMGKVAETLGPNCTARAVMERLKKLKKNANVRMDEISPHVVGSTSKMEAEYRAKREAEFAAVQPRKPRTMKAKTIPDNPGDDSEPELKKTDAKANATTTGRTRIKKGTARVIKKRKVKPTQEIISETETDDSSDAVEYPIMAETSHTGVAPDAGKAHKLDNKNNHHLHPEEAMDTDTLSPLLPTRSKRQQEATDTDPPSPSQPPQKKRQQAPPSVVQLESDNDSSTPSLIKKRKQEKDKVTDRPPTSAVVKRHRKHITSPTSREGEH